MNQALAAHFRLLERLPREQIRTHKARPVQVDKGGGQAKADTIHLNARILALHNAGKKRYEIAAILHVSKPTISRHIGGRVKAVQK